MYNNRLLKYNIMARRKINRLICFRTMDSNKIIIPTRATTIIHHTMDNKTTNNHSTGTNSKCNRNRNHNSNRNNNYNSNSNPMAPTTIKLQCSTIIFTSNNLRM